MNNIKILLCSALFTCLSSYSFSQAPANDNCAGATVLTIQNGSCTSATPGTTVNATKSPQSAFIPSASDDDVWYSFTTPAGGAEVKFNVLLTLTDVVFTGGSPAINLERRDGASEICNNTSPEFTSLFSGADLTWFMMGLLPSTQYSIRLYTDGESARVSYKICLTIPPPPANDNCETATLLTPALNACTPAGPFNTLAATKSLQPSGDGTGSDDDVWFKFTTDNVTMKYLVELSNRSYNSGFGNPVIELWDSCGKPMDPQPWQYKMFSPFSNQLDFGALPPNSQFLVRIYTYGTSGRFSSFNICLKKVPPPANDECSQAINLAVGPVGIFAPVVQGTTRNASKSSQTESPCFTMPDDDVWYQFTAPSTGLVGMKIDNITNPDGFGTPAMAAMLYSGSCNSLVNRLCLNANTGVFSGLTPGQVYILRVMTNDQSVAANFDITLQALMPPVNDDCDNAVNVPVNTDRTYTLFATGTTNLAAASATPLAPCIPVASNDVWYRFTAPEGGSVQMQLFNVTNPGGVSTAMYAILYNGSCASPVNMQCINSTSAVFSGLTGGAQYLLRVMSNSPGQYVNFSLGLRALLPPQDNGTCPGIRTLTTSVQRGTTLGLPMSNTTVACYGSVAPNKVLYYQFVATATSHYIDFSDFLRLSPSSNGLGFRVYKTGCGSDLVAQSVKCISSVVFGNEPVTGLTIGNTYFVQVMENTFNGGTVEFDIRLAPPNANIWLGTVDNKFENPANWSRNEVPDMNTEVIVPGGRPRGVVVSINTTVRKLKIDQGGNLSVAPGVRLEVLTE